MTPAINCSKKMTPEMELAYLDAMKSVDFTNMDGLEIIRNGGCIELQKLKLTELQNDPSYCGNYSIVDDDGKGIVLTYEGVRSLTTQYAYLLPKSMYEEFITCGVLRYKFICQVLAEHLRLNTELQIKLLESKILPQGIDVGLYTVMTVVNNNQKTEWSRKLLVQSFRS